MDMKITFQKLIFRNFLSYGNKDTVMEFSTPGLVSLSGSNGGGKSSALDALTFALYGKPYRKIKINELLNRTNKKNLFVQIYFQQNLVEYRITRTLHPNSVKVEKMNPTTGEFDELESLSSKALDQEQITQIFGIDFDTFKHIVAIASGASHSRPFLALPAGDKRKLIESVFNLEIIGELMKLVKADKSENKSALSTNSTTVDLYSRLVNQMTTQYNNSVSIINNFKDKKRDAITDLNNKRDAAFNEMQTLKSKVEMFEGFINRELYDEINDELSKQLLLVEESNKKIGECTARMKHAESVLSALDTNDICPSCNTQITDEHRRNEITNFSEIITNVVKDKKALQATIKNSNSIIAEKKKSLDDMAQAKLTYKTLVTKIDNMEKNIKEYDLQIQSKNNEELDINLQPMAEQIEENTENLNSAEKKYHSNLDTETILDIAEFLLSDNGIKTEFYSTITPFFNKTTNEYLSYFELPIVLTFDEEFNYTISSVQDKGELNYYSFSEGEKKRIDISVMLTFIKLSKSISNFNCNLILADEIFDGGIDSEGLILILETMKKIAAEEQLNVIIVSHKMNENSEVFDRNIVVSKEDGFSKMEFK